jgi:hypothetical protein
MRVDYHRLMVLPGISTTAAPSSCGPDHIDVRKPFINGKSGEFQIFRSGLEGV